MPSKSWQQVITRLMGNAATQGGKRPAPGGTARKPQVPGSMSPVLKALVAQAALPSQAQQALETYRSTISSLTARGRAGYEPGQLEQAREDLESLPIPAALGATTVILQELFQDCADVMFRGLMIGGKRPALLLYVEGLVRVERLERSVLDPLTQWADAETIPDVPEHLPLWLEAVATAITDTGVLRTVGEAVTAALAGDSVLLIDGVPYGLRMAVPGWEMRSIEEPISESAIRGPREGFVETLRINTSLLRRRLRTPHLKMETMEIGRRTRTTVAMVYLKDVTNPGLIDEVRRRLKRIDTDGIIDSGQIEEFIEDQPTSIFPQVSNTERPDRVVGGLLEGQVAILSDGSPFVLLAPATFWSFMHAGEDYYARFWIGTFLLWLRYLFLFIALAGPALYVAVTTFHQEMLPTTLLLSIAAAREAIPFPALFEIFMMEVFFEGLREAGVRLPRPVGQAVSIVGALVIGEAAVRAGLASAPVVIVVAATGIASFTFPRFNLGIAFRLLRFPLILLAGTLGLFGILLGLIFLLTHLCALRSFGVPYLQPVIPMSRVGLKDVLFRAPNWLMNYRPTTMNALNPKRQATWQRPGPGGDES